MLAPFFCFCIEFEEYINLVFFCIEMAILAILDQTNCCCCSVSVVIVVVSSAVAGGGGDFLILPNRGMSFADGLLFSGTEAAAALEGVWDDEESTLEAPWRDVLGSSLRLCLSGSSSASLAAASPSCPGLVSWPWSVIVAATSPNLRLFEVWCALAEEAAPCRDVEVSVFCSSDYKHTPMRATHTHTHTHRERERERERELRPMLSIIL